jgi:hypothetical protein
MRLPLRHIATMTTVVRAVVLVLDIARRKMAAEDRLRISTERHRRLADHAVAGRLLPLRHLSLGAISSTNASSPRRTLAVATPIWILAWMTTIT